MTKAKTKADKASWPHQDRRGHPRRNLGARFLMEETDGAAADCTALNVSPSGLLFLSSAPVPLYMKVAMEMDLHDQRPSAGDGVVRVDGVVVRSEDMGGDKEQYRIAVFFNRLDDASRIRLARYVDDGLDDDGA